MKVIINSYININDVTEAEAIDLALEMVSERDTKNEQRAGEEVITKLYCVLPVLGKILVVVADSDKEILGVDSNVLANVNIAEYPLEKLPTQLIEYKELIIKKGSSLTDTNILNAGQSIANATALKVMPHKIPVVKVINYNNADVSSLVVPSVFGANVFTSVSGIVNGGDADAGDGVIESSNNHAITREDLILMIGAGEDVTRVNTSEITNMHKLFDYGAYPDEQQETVKNFNQDISSWDVSSVTNMGSVFRDAKNFNQDISSWDVSSVTNMLFMFCGAKNFNQDISGWDVSSVIDMSSMFADAEKFNQDISSWDVSSVTDVFGMFVETLAFNQDLTSWNLNPNVDLRRFNDNSSLESSNCPTV